MSQTESQNNIRQNNSLLTLNKDHKEKYSLAPETVMLLTGIANMEAQQTPVSIENYTDALFDGEIVQDKMPEAIVQTYDNSLSVLFHYNLVSVGMDGKLRLTPNGKRAVDEKVVVSYPLGKGGTISSYNDTIATQTPAAGDALLRAISSNPRWLSDRGSSSMGVFLNSMAKHAPYTKASVGSVLNLYESMTQHFVNNPGSLPKKSISRIASSMISSWTTIMYSDIYNICNAVGGSVSLKNSVRVDADSEIIKIEEYENKLFATKRDVYTQEEQQVELSMFNHDILQAVRDSI